MALASTFADLAPPLAPPIAPSGGDWVEATAACADDAVLEQLLAGVAELYGTDRRDIMATRVVEVWTWCVATPAATALLADRRLPDVRAANVLIDPATSAIALRRPTFHALPGDPGCDDPNALLAPDEAALLAELRRALAEEHLAPLVERLNGLTRRPVRALWRSAADRVVGAFEWAGDHFGRREEAYALAARCLRDAPGPLSAAVRIEEVDGTPSHVRDGCCLYWRVDGAAEPCPNCPLSFR